MYDVELKVTIRVDLPSQDQAEMDAETFVIMALTDDSDAEGGSRPMIFGKITKVRKIAVQGIEHVVDQPALDLWKAAQGVTQS